MTERQCPVLVSFLSSVLPGERTLVNRAIYEELDVIYDAVRSEPISIERVKNRAYYGYASAFEAIVAVDWFVHEPTQADGLEDLYNLSEVLRRSVEDSLVSNMERLLDSAEESKAPSIWINLVLAQRLREAGSILLEETDMLRLALTGDEGHLFNRFGTALANIFSTMKVGLSKQLLFAKELQKI